MIKRFVVLLVFAITMSGDIGLLQDDGEVHTVTVDGFGSNLRFVPDTLTINEGDTVQFLWSGQLLPHNAIEQNEVFNSGDAERNVDYTYHSTIISLVCMNFTVNLIEILVWLEKLQ